MLFLDYTSDRCDFGVDFHMIEGALFSGATTIVPNCTGMLAGPWKTFSMWKTT